jgi:prepilin-type N-terminal cleavage/methylation domain-containing protein
MEAHVRTWFLFPEIRSGASRNKGFSMVELLLAAFIMAIGLLGLTMLQTMALKADTGSSMYTRAVRLGLAVADSVNLEGRNSTLFSKNNQSPATSNFGAAKSLYFDKDGNYQAAASGTTIYTATVTPADLYVATGDSGGMKSYSIVVSYNDMVNPSDPSKLIPRTVTFTRQVANGNYPTATAAP